MPDKEKIIENSINPDIVVQYLFIEKAKRQVKSINDDQGYQMGFFNIFIMGPFKNNTLQDFKSQLLDELNYCVKTYNHYKAKSINLKDYKFALVDNYRNITEFKEMDSNFFKALLDSLRNLMIVGRNFNIQNFMTHDLFNSWYDEYTNRR